MTIAAFPLSGKPRKLANSQMFLLSALAPSMAVLFTNPFDVVKVRLQLNGESLKSQNPAGVNAGLAASNKVYKNSLDCLVKMYRTEGVAALQKGLTPAIMRESSKNVFRLGMYDPIIKILHPSTDAQNQPPGWKRLLAGSICGAMGALSCNPFELLKTRLQSASSGSIAVGTQHNYTGVYNGLSTIIKNDGVLGLYRGSTLSVIRSIIGSGSNLWAYTGAKHYLMHNHSWSDNIYLDMVSGLFSGLVSVTCMNPVDVLRTRYYNQNFDANGKGKLYSSAWDTFRKITGNEGFSALYKGFTSHWFRSTHFCLTFVFLGMLRRGLLTHYDTQDLKETFNSIDSNLDGKLSRDELVNAIVEIVPRTSAHLRGEEGHYPDLIDGYVNRILNIANPTTHVDHVTLDQFKSVTSEIRNILRERQVRESFEWFDRSKTGKVEASDLQLVIRESLPKHQSMTQEQYDTMVNTNVSGLMRYADINGDDVISFAEFEKLVGQMDDVQKNKVLQRWMQQLVGEDT